MEKVLDQERIIALHNDGFPVEAIAAATDQPLAIVEEVIHEFDPSQLSEDRVVIIPLDLKNKKADLSSIQNNLLVCAEYIIEQSIININNDEVLNNLGKASVILKNVSDLAQSNKEASESKKSKFGKYFKA